MYFKVIVSRYLEQIALSRSLADIYGYGKGGLVTFLLRLNDCVVYYGISIVVKVGLVSKLSFPI